MPSHHHPSHPTPAARLKTHLSALTGGIGHRVLIAFIAATALWLTVAWALS